jgi:hypothetical protein
LEDDPVKNSAEKAFDGIPVGQEEAPLFSRFLDAHDFGATAG